MSYNVEKVSTSRCFDGELVKYKFKSVALGGTEAHFNVFIPPQAGEKISPVLFYLAGLTCTEGNGAQKGGFLRDAAAEEIALVFPDTSPRGAGIPGEDDAVDFGTGAGFYINATKEEWSKHYNMYDHVVNELPEAIKTTGIALDLTRISIMGHSMGGHGALSIYLKNTDRFKSCSAFAPIANPSNPESRWGKTAFTGYFKGGQEEGKAHDATELIRHAKGKKLNILADYGSEDKPYKEKQLQPENFEAAAREAGFDENAVKVQRQSGYDHGYYFVSTFAGDHIRYHAQFLREY